MTILNQELKNEYLYLLKITKDFHESVSSDFIKQESIVNSLSVSLNKFWKAVSSPNATYDFKYSCAALDKFCIAHMDYESKLFIACSEIIEKWRLFSKKVKAFSNQNDA